ncbi:hypothetical protein KSS87_022728 [Heliosperma pusillum]|nr:hypothetical protein KSS87_022728 [Heliosperma pusillum]
MAYSFSFSPATTPFRGQLGTFISRRKAFTVAGISPLPKLKTFPPLTLPYIHRRYHNTSIVAFAAPHEDSKPSEGEIELEKDNFEQAGKASQEAWDQVLASFKEQALKLQSVSQEAYEVYSKKAVVELVEDSRQYLAVAAENSPEPVKDVVETFASAEDLDDVSKVQDFYVGIPYGTILSAGGFLNFMLTGSISALRFGVILGGILLALSVSSLRSWKKGQSTERALKGQAG